MRSSQHPLSSALLLASLLMFPFTSPAQKTWKGEAGTGGDGTWAQAAQWEGGLPDSTSAARFLVDDTYTSPASIVAIESNVTASSLQVGHGRNVTLQLGAGRKIEAKGAISLVGGPFGTGEGAASLTIKGPSEGAAATAVFASFYVGYLGGSGHSLTFSGPITVTDAGTSFSRVGQGHTDGAATGNRLIVENGASLTRYGLWLGRSTYSTFGNEVVVTGKGSRLLVNGGGAASTRLLIGSEAGLRENALKIEEGGTVEVTTGFGGNAVNGVRVGFASGARSNHLSVEGADGDGNGSTLLLKEATNLEVGFNAGFGGNSVEVGQDGSITATGTVTIASFNANNGDNDGKNRLTIRNGGVVTASATIQNDGLLQLEAGGTLNGAAALNVGDAGRFEAAGSGLGSGIVTTLAGEMALGGNDRSAAAHLTLGSAVTMLAGSTLEMTIFGADAADRLTLGGSGSLDLQAGDTTFRLLLKGYEVAQGDQWSLFDGATAAGIVGGFSTEWIDLPELAGGLSWDLSRFNESGAWTVAVIPEPGIFPLAAGGAFLLLALGVRRRHRAAACGAVLAFLPGAGHALEEGYETDAVFPYHREMEGPERITGKDGVHLRMVLPGERRLEGFYTTAEVASPRLVTAGARVRGEGQLLFCLHSQTGWAYAQPVRLTGEWQAISLSKTVGQNDSRLRVLFLGNEEKPALLEVDAIHVAEAAPLDLREIEVPPLRYDAAQFTGGTFPRTHDPEALSAEIIEAGGWVALSNLPFPRTALPLSIYVRLEGEASVRLLSSRGGTRHTVREATSEPQEGWQWVVISRVRAEEMGDKMHLEIVPAQGGSAGPIRLDSIAVASQDHLGHDDLAAAVGYGAL
ncbi:MAG TPA: hypothetical protein VNQ90_06565 [Chthoniobacteraceae bacterium]|nr:hypothetical protein [Chthoniobacteraceae bacterium]